MCTEATLTGMHDDDNDDDHDDAQGNQETDMDCPSAVEWTEAVFGSAHFTFESRNPIYYGTSYSDITLSLFLYLVKY